MQAHRGMHAVAYAQSACLLCVAAIAASCHPHTPPSHKHKQSLPCQLLLYAYTLNIPLHCLPGLFRRPHYAKAGSDSDDDEPQGSADTETSKGSWYNQQDGPGEQLQLGLHDY